MFLSIGVIIFVGGGLYLLGRDRGIEIGREIERNTKASSQADPYDEYDDNEADW